MLRLLPSRYQPLPVSITGSSRGVAPSTTNPASSPLRPTTHGSHVTAETIAVERETFFFLFPWHTNIPRPSRYRLLSNANPRSGQALSVSSLLGLSIIPRFRRPVPLGVATREAHALTASVTKNCPHEVHNYSFYRDEWTRRTRTLNAFYTIPDGAPRSACSQRAQHTAHRSSLQDARRSPPVSVFGLVFVLAVVLPRPNERSHPIPGRRLHLMHRKEMRRQDAYRQSP